MAYSHTTLAQLRALLAARLHDSSYVFWLSDELDRLLGEAIRTWTALTSYRRERATVSTSAGTAFYELQTEIPSLLGYALTDSSLVYDIQYHLLEAATGNSWSGTDQFTLSDVTNALQRVRDQFLLDTGLVITDSEVAVGPSPPEGRVSLPDTVIAVRRLVWEPVTGSWSVLWKSDERAETSFSQVWSVDPAKPASFSVMSTRPVEVQLSPHPSDSGTLHLLSVSTGSTLDPTTGVVVGLPDDWTWAVKFGALADLLGKDGPAKDAQRSEYCAARYSQAVQLASSAPSVLHCEVNGVPLVPTSLQELDAFMPGWEGKSRGRPDTFSLAGHNLIAVSPVPDGVYSLTVDVVRKTGSLSSSTQIQVGREHLDAILDYAEHLAVFKCGGQEFASTSQHLERFLTAAKSYNAKITAEAPSCLAAVSTTADESRRRPRLTPGRGLGVLQ
jgi:hypothetical protein